MTYEDKVQYLLGYRRAFDRQYSLLDEIEQWRTMAERVTADLSGMPVEVMRVKESGCLGAAITAAVGSGTYASFVEAMSAMCPIGSRLEPDPSAAARYGEKLAYFRELAAALDTLPPAP